MDLSTRAGRREQGQIIQKAVEKAGLSVEDLANRIGCSRALIYQYLSGTTLAQPDRLQRIATEVGVPLAHFYGGADSVDTEVRRPRRSEIADPHARLDERIRQLEELARAQGSPPDWRALTSTCEQIASLASQVEDFPSEARAQSWLGKARIRLGEFSRAAGNLYRAADLFAGLGDREGEAEARQSLGNALLATGQTKEARAQFEWCASSDIWKARWSGIVSLAAVEEQQGDFRKAMEYCDQSAAVLEESSSEQETARGMVYVNANRVNLYMACGDFRTARALAQRCLDDAEAQGNGDQHLEARLNVGVCGFYLGDWGPARRILMSALQLARFSGDRGRESMARATLAILLAALSDCDSCIEHAKDALAAALALGDHRAELFSQMALADAYTSLGRDSEARYHANQALAVASAMRLALYEAECRLTVGRLSLRSGDFDGAADPIQRALDAAVALGARHVEAGAYVARGSLRLRRGDSMGASSDAVTAVAICQSLGLVPLEWEAQALGGRAAAAQPGGIEEASQRLDRAIFLMESVRDGLRESEVTDMVLEDSHRQDIYLERARLAVESGSAEEAQALVGAANWPPLAARLEPLLLPVATP